MEWLEHKSSPNTNYQNIIVTFKELDYLSSIKFDSSQELKICSILKNLANSSIALQQTSNRMKFIKIMKRRFNKLYKRSKNTNSTHKDFRVTYFRIKAEESKKYILKNLQTKSYTNTRAKVVFLYLKGKTVKDISDKFKISSVNIVDYLNAWQEYGFYSLHKQIHERNIVSEKDRIERSLIGRISGEKAKAVLDYLRKKEIQDIAKKHNVSRQTISTWLKDYREKGKSSLYVRYTRKTILTDKDKRFVSKILKENPGDFKQAYVEISKVLNKNFTDRTLKNFMKKHNISY